MLIRRRMLLSKGNITQVEANLVQTTSGTLTSDGTSQQNLVFYPNTQIISGKTYRISLTMTYNITNASASYKNVIFGNYSTFHSANFARLILPGNSSFENVKEFTSDQTAVANRTTNDIVLTLSIPAEVSGTVTITNLKMVEI